MLAFTTPTWATILFLAAGVVGALGVLWQKVFKPMVGAAKKVDEAMPPISEFVKVFKDDVDLISLLKTMADNHDAAMESAKEQKALAKENAVAIALLAAALEKAAVIQDRRVVADEVAVELAARDRETFRDLILQLDRINTKIETAAGLAQGVATDLAATHERADATEGSAGAAADAASKSPPEAET